MFHFKFSIILVICISIFISSCIDNVKKVNVKKQNNPVSINENFTFDYNLDTLKGIYIGDFGGSDIRLVLNFISNKHAVGYNIHKGLQRNISGPVVISEKTIDITMNEPGDNEYDGVFTLKIDKANFKINGYWKSNNVKVPKKYFVLEKLANFKIEDEIEENVILNKYNFSHYFYQVRDSLGKINFSEDGLCTYVYYPSYDENERKEQLITFKGSWTLKNENIIIEWQKNSIFKNSSTSFEIIRRSEYIYDAVLKGENRELYQNYY